MKFDELWKYQQGALFLKKDMIYDLRKDLASYFYEAGYYDAKEEMSYDVHTCHNKCTRLMCVQRREITELTRKLEIAKKALDLLRHQRNGYLFTLSDYARTGIVAAKEMEIEDDIAIHKALNEMGE